MRAFSLLVKTLILPPMGLILLALLGLVLWRRKPRLGRALCLFAGVSAGLLSLPFVAYSLISIHQVHAPLDFESLSPDASDAQAIVILSADSYSPAREYAAPTVGRLTLERMRYGASLSRQTGLPVLTTGGVMYGETESLASMMRRALEEEFRVPVEWVEEASFNTRANARGSARILLPEGIQRIYLVTHAWHMPRSLGAFREAGFEVTPAPVGYVNPPNRDLRVLLPSAEAFRLSYWALHEGLGRVWYGLLN